MLARALCALKREVIMQKPSFPVRLGALSTLSSTLFVALGLIGSAPAQATPQDAELVELRQAVQQMRAQYESRLQALEQRLQEAEVRASRPADPTKDVSASNASPVSAEAGVGNKPQAAGGGFNPSVALILSGNYAHLSQNPDTWSLGNFPMAEGETGPGTKGFNLGESEVTFSANIDPWWYGALTLAFSPENEASAEEAFIQTTALSNGLKIKAGRFLSGLGYLNEQHAHTWDFVDAPLSYQAFLGGQLRQDGVQAKWLLPTDQFIEFGAEAARGQASDNGAGRMALFAHAGGDVGVSHSWRAGVSQLWERNMSASFSANNPLTGIEATNTFTGRNRVTVIDGVWKWAPNGNATRTNFKVQGEYFRRQAQGQLLAGLDPADDTVPGQLDAYSATQSGWYLQGIYQFAPGWRVGLRRDQLSVGKANLGMNADLIEASTHNPRRDSVMLDWALSEFSRWRIQFNRDQTRPGTADNQIYLQYQMSLGAHGAHGY
jgi:hypothetical protein